MKIGLTEVDCEDGRWIELVQNRVQWRTSVLNFLVLLSKRWFINSGPTTHEFTFHCFSS